MPNDPMTDELRRTMQCENCGGLVTDVFAASTATCPNCHVTTMVWPPKVIHGPFNHTPRCNTGGCHD